MLETHKYRIVPIAALVLGLVGAALRLWVLSTAFEPATGLPLEGAVSPWVLLVFSVAAGGILLFLSQGKPRQELDGDTAFAARGDMVYMTLMTAGALLVLVSAVYGMFAFAAKAQMSPLRIVLVVAQVPVTVSMLLVGQNNYRCLGKGKESFAVLIPAYAGCLWLVEAYREHTADPVLLDYMYLLMAIIALVLGIYFQAGFSFGRGKLPRTVFFSTLGIYLGCVALADGYDLSTSLLLCGMILYNLASLSALLYNAGRKRRRLVSPKDLPPEPPELEEFFREGQTGEEEKAEDQENLNREECSHEQGE